MKFKNQRFSTDRLKLAQQNAVENNQSVVRYTEGWDPVSQKDRNDDTIVWDRSVGALSYSEDASVMFCLPFRKEEDDFIADADPYNRIATTKMKMYE